MRIGAEGGSGPGMPCGENGWGTLAAYGLQA